MKKKGINFFVPLVIYPFDIFISIGENDEEFRNGINKKVSSESRKDLEDNYSILELSPNCDGHTVNIDSSLQTIIRIKRHPTTPKDYGTIGHEVFHAVSFIFWRIDIPLDIGKTGEVYAYLIDYVTTEIYKKI